LKSSSQISDPTAAETAMVLEVKVRKTLIPRRRWLSSTARTRPRAIPIGTVYSAKISVANMPVRNSSDESSSR
jgi:hypothetical protein